MDFKSLIRSAVQKAGSVSALAARLKVSRQAIYAWLSGSSIPSGRHVVALISFTKRRREAA